MKDTLIDIRHFEIHDSSLFNLWLLHQIQFMLLTHLKVEKKNYMIK